MRIKYFEDTDTSLLELGGGAPTETRDLSEDITLDLDESEHTASITIEHASVKSGSQDIEVGRMRWGGGLRAPQKIAR